MAGWTKAQVGPCSGAHKALLSQAGDAAEPPQPLVIPTPAGFLGLAASWHKGSEQLQLQIHPRDPQGTAGDPSTAWPRDFGIQTEHPRAGIVEKGDKGEHHNSLPGSHCPSSAPQLWDGCSARLICTTAKGEGVDLPSTVAEGPRHCWPSSVELSQAFSCSPPFPFHTQNQDLRKAV